jgi:hypothetical protein
VLGVAQLSHVAFLYAGSRINPSGCQPHAQRKNHRAGLVAQGVSAVEKIKRAKPDFTHLSELAAPLGIVCILAGSPALRFEAASIHPTAALLDNCSFSSYSPPFSVCFMAYTPSNLPEQLIYS